MSIELVVAFEGGRPGKNKASDLTHLVIATIVLRYMWQLSEFWVHIMCASARTTQGQLLLHDLLKVFQIMRMTQN